MRGVRAAGTKECARARGRAPGSPGVASLLLYRRPVLMVAAGGTCARAGRRRAEAEAGLRGDRPLRAAARPARALASQSAPAAPTRDPARPAGAGTQAPLQTPRLLPGATPSPPAARTPRDPLCAHPRGRAPCPPPLPAAGPLRTYPALHPVSTRPPAQTRADSSAFVGPQSRPDLWPSLVWPTCKACPWGLPPHATSPPPPPACSAH